eukprot:jgi/Tetstr1/433352/TSEL_022638.t1
MRLPRVTFQELVRRVEPLLQPDDNCKNPNLSIPAYFKVGVGVHHLAHGGSFHATAGHAHIAESTARKRQMGNIGLAVDGTHIPWQPDCHEWMDEFRNYK